MKIGTLEDWKLEDLRLLRVGGAAGESQKDKCLWRLSNSPMFQGNGVGGDGAGLSLLKASEINQSKCHSPMAWLWERTSRKKFIPRIYDQENVHMPKINKRDIWW